MVGHGRAGLVGDFKAISEGCGALKRLPQLPKSKVRIGVSALMKL
jgi:hypothetical protein